MGFGEVLKAVLEEKGITQEKFSKRAGISVRTVSRYVSGEREPTVSVFMKVSEAVGYTPEKFLRRMASESKSKVSR